MTSESSRWQGYVLPIGIVAGILVILVPLPAVVMDVLLVVNITVAVVVLLTTIYIGRPLEFSIFPSLLLATTLGRLVLNIATTRLILSHADTTGMLAAGEVVQAFGQFVAGDRIVVGLIMFVIIVVIQFVVITKGATRISEVAARFTLDGMPGRQMAIDADLNAGAIDHQEARRRREDLTRQADFYGAMDGASKFVRGDAIAGILITVVNIMGGLVIGVVQAGMPLTDAVEIYTMLTIGDGLASQVPALLISIAAGLLVTRSTQVSDLPTEFLQQLFARPQALVVAAGFLGVLVFTNLPAIPLVAIGAGCCVIAWLVTRERKQQAERTRSERQGVDSPRLREDRLEDYLAVDPMEMEIGVGLIRLADPNRGGDLLTQIMGVRRKVAAEIGIVLPKVRIRDNMRLERNAYRINIANSPVATGHVYPSRWLATNAGGAHGPLDGEPARDPIHDQPAFWISPDARTQAESQGYQPMEATAVLAAHLREVVHRNADELLTRDATRHLIDELRKSSPVVVEELIPDVLNLGEVQQVLRRLLREDVPIRPLNAILESLGDFAPKTKDPVLLTEYARQRLARTLCTRYRDADGRLHVVTIDPELEAHVADQCELSDQGVTVRMSPASVDRLNRNLADALSGLTRRDLTPIVLTSPRIRYAVKQLTAAKLPRLVVLSYSEISPDTRVEAVGMLGSSSADLVAEAAIG